MNIKTTTCEQVVEIFNTHAQYAEVVGKFICHDGQQVWVELNGCGASDSHTFTHKHIEPEQVNGMFNGKLIRLKGERAWDNFAEIWGYRWTIHQI